MEAPRLDAPAGPLALNKGHNAVHEHLLAQVEGKENSCYVAVKNLTIRRAAQALT